MHRVVQTACGKANEGLFAWDAGLSMSTVGTEGTARLFFTRRSFAVCLCVEQDHAARAVEWDAESLRENGGSEEREG